MKTNLATQMFLPDPAPADDASDVLTIRDYIAIQIAQGLIASGRVGGLRLHQAGPEIARDSYALADAMLQRRQEDAHIEPDDKEPVWG
jgi:hypothetical protein